MRPSEPQTASAGVVPGGQDRGQCVETALLCRLAASVDGSAAMGVASAKEKKRVCVSEDDFFKLC